MCMSLWVLGKIWIRSAKGCWGKKKPHQPLCTSALLVQSWLMWRAYKTCNPHHEECDDGRQHTLTLNVMESSMDEYPKWMINYSNTPYTSWNSWEHSESNWKKKSYMFAADIVVIWKYDWTQWRWSAHVGGASQIWRLWWNIAHASSPLL